MTDLKRAIPQVIALAAVAIAPIACAFTSPPLHQSLAQSPSAIAQASEQVILDAYAQHASNVMVEAAGQVDRLLSDDLEGSRHQRFIVRLSSGHTVLISHNIDLAPRIDALRQGDTVRFRGEYEWNSQGGVVHWTHHDPNGSHPGGWIEHQGQRYE
ncbi:MAG: DUF3465 domain-containing protein [Thainema sp.]